MINRTVNKQKAKRILNENGNLSGMIGMEILYGMISKITEIILAVAVIYVVGAVMGILIAPFAWMGIVGAVLAALIIVPLGYFVMIVALGAITGPFEVAHNRYYLYLKKNGIRAKAISIFDSFDFFVQFALVTGTRMVTIMWVPLLEAVFVLAITIFIAAVTKSLVAAVVLAVLGGIAVLGVAIARACQLWPMAYIQADHPQLNAEQVLERCCEMTNGHEWELFVFELSYIGWDILNAFTFGIVGVLYATPYRSMARALIYEELKGRPIALDDIKASTDGNGMTIAIDPKKLFGINKKEIFGIPARPVSIPNPTAAPAIFGVSGMYAGSTFPLTPNQPVVLGRDGAFSQIVFSQGAQKISRRHCEVMFNSQTQQYRVTDFSSNGTYVNGKRLPANAPIKLARGTEVSLGDNNNVIKLV